jgi:hypothetical protein
MTPIIRYSYTRDAYVLRGVGRHVGPVYQPAKTDEAPRGTSRRRWLASGERGQGETPARDGATEADV